MTINYLAISVLLTAIYLAILISLYSVATGSHKWLVSWLGFLVCFVKQVLMSSRWVCNSLWILLPPLPESWIIGMHHQQPPTPFQLSLSRQQLLMSPVRHSTSTQQSSLSDRVATGDREASEFLEIFLSTEDWHLCGWPWPAVELLDGRARHTRQRVSQVRSKAGSVRTERPSLFLVKSGFSDIV